MSGLKDLYALIESRRRELGLTQAEVTKRAFGRDGDTSPLQNIRRGSSPRLETLESICDALDLEVYIGPRRTQAYDGSWAHDGSMLYNGEPPAPEVSLDGTDVTLIPFKGVEGSAGWGADADFPEDDAMRIAINTSWLRDRGIAANGCAIIRVKGDSMAGTLPDGALVLVDQAQTEPDKKGRIFVFLRDGFLFIKRLRRTERGVFILSDNLDYDPDFIPSVDVDRELDVKGRVRAMFAGVE